MKKIKISKFCEIVFVTSILLLLAGCAGPTINIKPVQLNMKSVCLIDNPKVTIDGFKGLIVEKLQEKGVNIKDMYEVNSDCLYSINYTARRSWDFVRYLADAEITVNNCQSHQQVGYLNFHQPDNLNMNKLRSFKTTIGPALDKLLINQK